MLSERELSAAIGSTAYDGDGSKIGTVEHFYVDDRTGAPTWVAVTTGLFGTRHSVAPAADASFADGDLRLPVSADAVKNAPHVAGSHLDPEEEADLRRHYGLGTGLGADAGTGLGADAGTDLGAGRDARAEDADLAAAPTQEMQAVVPPVPGPTADTDGGMTRSEEQVRVGLQQVATTRVRLVKYVVTEDVQITVPIRREEIRVEHVPLDAVDDGPGESLTDTDDTAMAGREAPVSGRLPDEIVLHTERPVVTVEVVPVERVRLRTEIVEGQETITEQVQREQIVVDETPTPGLDPR
jgi:stress response protein YsnF